MLGHSFERLLMSCRKRSSVRRGFSLIEMLIVLTVVGLMLAAASPSVAIWIRNLQIRGVAEAMQNGLQQARMEAMRRNQTVRFSLVSNLTSSCSLSASARSWVISLDDPTSAGSKCATALSSTTTPRIIAVYAGAEGNSVAASVAVAAVQADTTTAATSVVFDGLGRVSGTTGIARMSFDNSTSGNDFRPLRVTVGNGGNVRMCDPRVSVSSDDPRRC